VVNEKLLANAKLITKILPHLNATPNFSLKGGAAINFFALDLPRVSVDIDLTYLPLQARDESIAAIEAGLETLADSIKASMKDVKVTYRKNKLGSHD